MRKKKRTRPDKPAGLNYARIVYELLVSERGWRVSDLKSELGISDRTYRHYRQRLQSEFAPLWSDDGSSLIAEMKEGSDRYLRIRSSPQDTENLYAEVAAYYMAVQLFKFVKDTSLWPTVERMFSDFKSRPGMTQILDHVFRNIDRLFYYLPFAPKDYSRHGEKITKIIRALINRQRITMKYRPNPQEPVKEHRVEPLTLVLYFGGLYLVAWYPGVKKCYQFVIDRMTEVSLESGTFRYPPEHVYSPSRVFEGTFGGLVESKAPPTDVELVFADRPWLKQYLRERRWHPSQRFEDLPDGRLRMRMRISGLTSFNRWAQSFGRDVEVIKPV